MSTLKWVMCNKTKISKNQQGNWIIILKRLLPVSCFCFDHDDDDYNMMCDIFAIFELHELGGFRNNKLWLLTN